MVIMEARVGLILSNAALLVFDEAAVEMANTKSAHAVTSIKHQASSVEHGQSQSLRFAQEHQTDGMTGCVPLLLPPDFFHHALEQSGGKTHGPHAGWPRLSKRKE